MDIITPYCYHPYFGYRITHVVAPTISRKLLCPRHSNTKQSLANSKRIPRDDTLEY